jgi:hypothetical protein
MVQAPPKAAAVTEVQPLAGAAEAAQQLAPPEVRAVAAEEEEVPRVLEASVAQRKAAGAAQAAQDAAAEPQPGAASDAEVLLPAEREVPDVAAVAPRQGAEAERAWAVALRLEAEAERAWAGAVLLPGAAVPVAEVQPRAVRDAQAVLPSAAAWAAALSTQLREDRLARSLSAQSAHARARLRIAQP